MSDLIEVKKSMKRLMRATVSRIDVPKLRKLASDLERKIQAMTPSITKDAQGAIEGQLESAIELYYSKRLQPKNTAKNHWTKNQAGFLKKLIKANTSKDLRRGFVFTINQIEGFIASVHDTAYDLALGH